MAELSFYGAAGTVTGSRHLLDINGTRLLVDCGLFQGSKQNRKRNWEPFPVEPAAIDRLLLTHAHIDHTGYIPRLCRDGFYGPIHCTYPTADLCEVLLPDSAYLQEEDARWANKKGHTKHKPALPLYTAADAEKALESFKPVFYGQNLFVEDGLRVKFKDAGHLLGSSFIDIKVAKGPKARKILFSGDVGKPGRPILRDPVQVYDVDYLVLESTYGDRLHDDVSPRDELARVINESVERGGLLVVPSFAVGRTQTLLYAIRELEEQGDVPTLPIYVDSPMAIDATTIFEKRLTDLNLRTRIEKLRGKQILRPDKVKFCRTKVQSIAINNEMGPAIIISSSGMAVGGRILHHLARCLPDQRNTIMLVGYQVPGTRGRSLLDGQSHVKIHGRQIPVMAQVENINGYSGHADYREILAWLMGFNRPPKKTFIVHGDEEASAAMAQHIRERFDWDVEIPEYGETFALDL